MISLTYTLKNCFLSFLLFVAQQTQGMDFPKNIHNKEIFKMVIGGSVCVLVGALGYHLFLAKKEQTPSTLEREVKRTMDVFLVKKNSTDEERLMTIKKWANDSVKLKKAENELAQAKKSTASCPRCNSAPPLSITAYIWKTYFSFGS
jgi:hypothetical protein